MVRCGWPVEGEEQDGLGEGWVGEPAVVSRGERDGAGRWGAWPSVGGKPSTGGWDVGSPLSVSYSFCFFAELFCGLRASLMFFLLPHDLRP